MNSDMNSPAGQQSTGTATHPPTAAVTAARAAANEAAGKAGLEAVQTMDKAALQILNTCIHTSSTTLRHPQ